MDEMPGNDRRSRRWWKPTGWIVLGLTAGVVYGLVDDAFDSSLVTGGPLHAFERVHRAFNATIPPVAGMVVGLLIAYLRQRGELIEAERRAAETIKNRLAGIERQQAAWLLASSLLHEIRGPLHAMGLLLEEIEGTKAIQSDDALGELISKASKQAERIEQRISSLRKLAESPRGKTTKVDVESLLQKLVADVADLAAARAVTVDVQKSEETIIYADEWAIRTCIENLLTNAIEAAGEASEPKRVSLETEKQGTLLMVKVVDSGKGIEPQLTHEIFEPLQAGKRRGLGLGLPLSRALARHEGGDVKLLKTGANGTTFAYYLPIAEMDQS